jgi:hypothetical protein
LSTTLLTGMSGIFAHAMASDFTVTQPPHVLMCRPAKFVMTTVILGPKMKKGSQMSSVFVNCWIISLHVFILTPIQTYIHI